jgi:O-antigen/teichoic acid export membrane protein
MAITFSAVLGNGVAKAILCFAVDRRLRLRPAYASRRSLKEMLGYSVWNFLALMARNTRTQFCPLLIGALLGVALLTPFSVAARLTAYALLALETTAEILTPLATALHAQGDHERLWRLLKTGTRYGSALALYLGTGVLLLGEPFVRLWIGPDMAASAAPLAAVLTLGELLPAALLVGKGLLQAKARHRSFTVLSLLEVVCVCALIVVLSGWGLTGAALALAVPAFLFRGLLLTVQVCRVAAVPVRRFVREGLAGPVAASLLPAATLAAVATWRSPRGWLELALYGAGYTLAFGTSAALVLGLKGLPLPSVLARKTAPVPAPGASDG